MESSQKIPGDRLDEATILLEMVEVPFLEYIPHTHEFKELDVVVEVYIYIILILYCQPTKPKMWTFNFELYLMYQGTCWSNHRGES